MIANVYRLQSEKQIESDRRSLSFYRNERKYFEDIFDIEKNHVEIVAHQIAPYIVDRSVTAHTNFINKGNEVKKKNLRFQRRGAFIIGVGALFSLFLLFFRGESTGLNKGYSFAILVSTVLMYQEMKHLLTTLGWDKNAMYYAKKYLEFMDLTERERKEDILLVQDISINQMSSVEEVHLRGVTLKYGEKTAVNQVTHTFRRGQKVLLIGDNGSGKSSLSSLLAGLYRPSGGHITDLREQDFPAVFLKSRTAYVSQSFPMLSISVRESFLSERISDNEMWWALDKVGLMEKVKFSPFGLGSIVGKDVFFSKGQWQCFAIARLLAQKEKDIWILDEPTSAMNAIYEEKVLKSVLQEGRDKILVVVSHRLGFAPEMDEIIHLENGMVRCCGNHQYLMTHDSRYKELFESQKGIYR
ncbi:MAG: ABC transporter ATP-binding protein [Bacillota bacterium]|nr:ABC transporter ATP-binding protein [Bacillota bacterium]